jgi:DNA-binding transcriptional LysR family regulator
MDLDLRLVRYFVTVADELHFGRAAATLYISQPALSKQIRKLEEQLGTSLLIRDSRHVQLTTRGQRFLDEARQLLAIAQRMQERPQADVVRIAHIYELDTSRDVADAYSRAHPDIQLVERAMDSITQLAALLEKPPHRCMSARSRSLATPPSPVSTTPTVAISALSNSTPDWPCGG